MSFESLGEYFGYPKCCIESFAGLKHLGNLPDSELIGTGFVPCAICAATKSADEIKAEIAEKRVCKLPFPNGTGDDVWRTHCD